MISRSIEDTCRFASGFVELLLANTDQATVIRLVGDLGSGKTSFVKGVASALGIDSSIVTSPTFVIMKSYEIRRGRWKRLVHIDAFRIKNEREAETIRLGDIFSDPWTIVFVEWPERIDHLIPKKHTTIEAKFIDESNRQIEVQ